jgi:hypothetical protein
MNPQRRGIKGEGQKAAKRTAPIITRVILTPVFHPGKS